MTVTIVFEVGFGMAAKPPKVSVISRATAMYAETLSEAEGEVEEPQP